MRVFSLRCFAFAELPWYQRKVAALIFSTPPTSTYEEVCVCAHVCWIDLSLSRTLFRLLASRNCWQICPPSSRQALEFFLKAEEGKIHLYPPLLCCCACCHVLTLAIFAASLCENQWIRTSTAKTCSCWGRPTWPWRTKTRRYCG